MQSSLTKVTLSEHTFIVQTGFEPCGNHAEGRGCFVEMAWLLEESICYREHLNRNMSYSLGPRIFVVHSSLRS